MQLKFFDFFNMVLQIDLLTKTIDQIFFLSKWILKFEEMIQYFYYTCIAFSHR